MSGFNLAINYIILMSTNRSIEPLAASEGSDPVINNAIYPPNREDQSPINEDAQPIPLQLLSNHLDARSSKGQGRFSLMTEIAFWVIVALLVLGIGYYLNDNSKQENEITAILDKAKNAESTKATKPVQTSRQIKANASSLPPTSILKEPTDVKVFQNAWLQEEPKDQDNNTSHDQIKLKSYLFDEIPNRVWHFSSKNQNKSTLWTQKSYQQHQRFALGSKNQFLTINTTTFGSYLPLERYKILKSTIKNLNLRYRSRQEPELMKHRDLLVKQLIILEVLIENGGIFIDEDIILTQDLHWINSISENPFVNAKEWIKKAVFISFHSVEFSSPLMYQQSLPNIIQAERYVVHYPSISSYFMACNKGNQFLKNLRDNFYTLLSNPSQIKQLIKNNQISASGLRNKISFYDNIFEVSSLLTLRNKQRQLGNKGQAVKHFQLATINQNFGPTKIKAYLTDKPVEKIYNHLSRMTRKQLEYQFGPLRYMLKIEPQQEMYVALEQSIQKKSLIGQSLIHETLFNSLKDTFIENVPLEMFSQQKWDDLPAKVWIYSDEQSYETDLFNQIWIQNTKTIAKQSNFEIIIVNQSNLAQYLPKETIQLIQDAISPQKRKLEVYRSTKIQLISLALIYEHGGIWVSPETFLVDSLEWVRSINKEPFIWNKNGKTPKVVLTFQPHYGSPFEWKYNKVGIKQSWHLAYENSFIAAVPKADLIKDWLNEIITNLAIPFQTLISKFFICKIFRHKWISDKDHEMLAHDCIKCLLGAKMVELAIEGKITTPNEYYGLWAINGYAGFLKMREYTSFVTKRSMENPLVWQYSFAQMQTLAGKVNHITRIYRSTSSEIERIYRSNVNSLSKVIHKDSFVMALLSKINGKVILKDNRLFLQSEYAKYKLSLQKKEEQKLLVNMQQVIWIYEGGDIDGEDSFVKKNMLENIEYYAKMSQYQIRVINRHNYEKWLKETRQDVSQFLKTIKQKLDKEKSNLKDHYENILGQYITLSILYQLGGIAVNKKIILHENLNWVKNPSQISFVNQGGESKPKVLAFFGPGYSAKKTINKNNKQFVMYPSLQNYFIASGKKTAFIKDFRQQFKSVIFQSTKCKKRLQEIGHQTVWLRGDDPYYESFFLASQFAISNKNKQLQNKKINQNALDYYGLYTLNSRLYAYKLTNFLNKVHIKNQNLYQYLAMTPLGQIQQQIGPLKYFSIIPKYNELKKYISSSSSGEKGFQIMQKSFLHQYLTLDSQKSGIVKFQGTNTKKQNKQWSSLPQDVWIYVAEGLQSSKFMTRLMFIHLNKTFSDVKYKVHEVNDSNIDKHLDNNMKNRIDKITAEKNNKIHRESLIKLALLLKYGGVFILPNVLITQKPTWLKEIANFQGEFIFNRFGGSPKILMLVDTLRSSSKWRYSQGIKIGHNLGWIDDFIAAEKDNELIKQWLNMLLEYLQADSKKQQKMLSGCELKDNKRSHANLDQLSLDILQCIINTRQTKLQKQKDQKQACNYYGLWGLSEFLGPAKLQEQINLDVIENDLNPFLWKWSRTNAESLIGKFHFMARLNNKQLSSIGQLIGKNKLTEWGKNGSLLSEILYSTTRSSLDERDGKIVIRQ